MAEIVPSDAVRAIQESVKTETIDVRGRSYVTRKVLRPPDEPMPETLTVHTLSGVALFCNTFPKGRIAYIHIDSASGVFVLGPLDEQSQQRPCYVAAKLFREKQFPFGATMSQENFLIGIQTAFVESANRQKFLQIASAVETGSSTRLSDDGISQKIITRKGTSLESEVDFKNPVWLAPYRTFPEIDQPESPFVFRTTGEGLLALHETLETEWQLKAIAAMAQYFKDNVSGVSVLH